MKEEIENSAQRLSATLHASNAAAYTLDSTRPPVVFYRHIESTESDGNAVRVFFSCTPYSKSVRGQSNYDRPWVASSDVYHRSTETMLSKAAQTVLILVKMAVAENRSTRSVREGLEEVPQCSEKTLLDSPLKQQMRDKKSSQSSVAAQSKYLMQRYGQYGLTLRECECLFYLIRGFPIKSIAGKMGITAKAVDAFSAKVRSKLGCTTKAALVEKIFNDGVLGVMPPCVNVTL